MKVLILGPKARYEAYMPEFVAQLPFETAYCSLDLSLIHISPHQKG